MAKNLRWLWALCLATVVLAIVLVGGPALRQHYVLQALRAGHCSFSTHEIGPKWFREWIGRERMQALETIYFVDIGPVSLPLILENRRLFVAVEAVGIDEHPTSPAVLREILGDGQNPAILPGVDFFSTWGNPNFGDEHLAAMADSSTIRVLSVYESEITDDGMVSFRKFPRLERLYLNDTCISDAGIRHLSDKSALQRLWLSGTGVGDDAARIAGTLPHLEILHMENTRLSDEGLRHLMNAPSLQELGMGSTAITDAGLAVLPTMRNLESVDLWGTSITDMGLESVAKAKSLEWICLWETRITDDGLMKLLQLPKSVEILVDGTRVTKAGRRKFIDARKAAGLPPCALNR